MEKQTKPGDKTKIIMKAKPGSRVAISALDKSVLLLRNANEIKKSKVRNNLIESLANTTATATWSSTIALTLKDKGECKLHGLKRCAMP
jgi:hypothetical protein